jgi:tRNA-Thr(GGU) m(6)t(6)A37 methyltransferase TsaA
MTDRPTLTLTPIGVIRSPHREPAGTPIQPAYAAQHEGRVIVDPEFETALDDIDGFERVWLIYWFDRAGPFEPRVIPYGDTGEHGLFATRFPSRPNPIGLSVVRLLGREANVLRVSGIDVLDGTPLLDIKPYVPEFDAHARSRAGWRDERRGERRAADGRARRDSDPST